LPKDVFNQFTAIYLDQSLKTIEKLKLLDELFMTLPDNMLKKLPIPSAFRRLPLEERRRIHRIFYAKTIPFRDKLRRLEQFMRELPGQKRELVPIRPIQTKRLGSAERRGEQPMPTLVEFDVPVLLQFNGHMVGLENGFINMLMELEEDREWFFEAIKLRKILETN
jgi:hypothetical protein